MIKHIVCWRLKKNAGEKTKSENLFLMKKKLLSLKFEIEELKYIEVGINDENAAENNYDIVLISDFENYDSLNNYQKHPAHVDVATFIKNITESRVAVDYVY